ncbi:MAG: hypothetical protein AAB017_08520 [Nitrospirota bacterium]
MGNPFKAKTKTIWTTGFTDMKIITKTKKTCSWSLRTFHFLMEAFLIAWTDGQQIMARM